MKKAVFIAEKPSVAAEFAKALKVSPRELMGWDEPDEEPLTIAAHFDGDEYTEEELDEIKAFAEFVKTKRK